MAHSPNKVLGDIIKVENADISKINIYCIDNTYFVSGPTIRDFLKENNIEDRNTLLESLSMHNNISYIHVLDETCLDDAILFENDFVLIDESINPLEVERAVKGRSLMMKFINQATAFITNREYDDMADLDRYIKRCDKMIDAIHEEKKSAQNKEKTSRGLFSLMFVVNIAKNIFTTFFMPLILKNINIQLPSAISKIFTTVKSIGSGSGKFAKVVKAGKIVGTVYSYGDLAFTVCKDVTGVYLSITDYTKLLDNYENQLKKVRTNLYSQKITLQKKENR